MALFSAIGAVVGSNAQKSAAKTAANTAKDTAAQNNALAANIYGQNKSALTPYMAAGAPATDRISALLGLAPGGAQAANDAFAAYRAGTGYDFRLGEGQRAINSGYAARGMLESGAAQRSLAQYGQNIASDEFGRYFSALQGQQGVGFGAASALAGVGQNYAGLVTANNNNAGSAAANAALISGNATANMWSQLGGAAGRAAGAFLPGGFGSSYGF